MMGYLDLHELAKEHMAHLQREAEKARRSPRSQRTGSLSAALKSLWTALCSLA
jgi:hypothetical protein